MNTVKPHIIQDSAPVFFILLSFIPLMLIGFILDILLVHFFSMVKGNTSGLNSVSLWVYHHLAGYRFLPQELMAAFWFLMIIVYILIFFQSEDPQQGRLRFFYSFFFIWGGVISVAGCLLLACLSPFDLLLARLEGTTWLGNCLPTVLIVELLVIILLPIVLFIWRKGTVAKPVSPVPPSPDASTPP